MSRKGLIYSFVAKGTIVLAEHTAYSGNVSTVAVQCLQKLPSGSTKYTYSCDGYTFNFLLDSGFVFLLVADESVGRGVPFVFLERVKDDFKKLYGASFGNDHLLADDSDDDLFEDRFSIAYNLDREFGPKIKEQMEYCLNHPDEMSKLSKLKAQITEVKGIMMDNIEKVLDRGEKIELLVDKTENLQFQADSFHRQGRQLRRKMWLQNLRMKLMDEKKRVGGRQRKRLLEMPRVTILCGAVAMVVVSGDILPGFLRQFLVVWRWAIGEAKDGTDKENGGGGYNI
ncbi:hypothetical protein SSX86_018541 [Deinandra increscens subsp. villosa]|uniref:Uncharacterized protein n=1 Tax=Deinandra increscens subsp. villosa TaxID=3103831 RepID=A0AAP0CQX0_9ASTR